MTQIASCCSWKVLPGCMMMDRSAAASSPFTAVGQWCLVRLVFASVMEASDDFLTWTGQPRACNKVVVHLFPTTSYRPARWRRSRHIAAHRRLLPSYSTMPRRRQSHLIFLPQHTARLDTRPSTTLTPLCYAFHPFLIFLGIDSSLFPTTVSQEGKIAAIARSRITQRDTTETTIATARAAHPSLRNPH